MENNNLTCPVCDIKFHVKPSHQRRRKYCSQKCRAEGFKIKYLAENNPNYSGAKLTHNGRNNIMHKIPHHRSGKLIAMHRAIICEYFDIETEQLSGRQYHIHHKDTDIFNNTIDNLVLVEPSDHKWLHHEYGNAIMYNLFCTKRIDLNEAISWSKDPDKALRLLTLDIKNQTHYFEKLNIL